MSKENQNTPETPEEPYQGILGDYEETAEEETAAAQEETAEESTQEGAEKKSAKKPLVIAGISVAAVALAGCLGYVGVNLMKQNQPVSLVESANYHIAAPEYTCYFNETMNMFIDYYGEDGLKEYFGLDLTQSLKEQASPNDETQTWFDVVTEQTNASLEQLLVFYEAAKAEGFTLSDEEKQAVEDELAERDYSSYGNGVTEADMRRCIELQHLVNAYYDHVDEVMEVSDEELEGQYASNRLSYDTCGLVGFSISYPTEEELASEAAAEDEAVDAEDADAEDAEAEDADAEDTDAEAEDTDAEDAEAEDETPAMTAEIAKQLTDELAACKDADAFAAKVTDILVTYEGYSQSDAEENYVPTIFNDSYSYTEGSELAEWAFGGAKVGETYVIEGDGAYYIYMLTAEPARNDQATVNVRHILFMNGDDDMGDAESALAEWEAGDRTEDSFAALAEQYSQDPGSSSNGGLYENVTPGQMVQTFNDWCFDPSRQPGDTGIVETEYGVHVMYFVSTGDPQWKNSARAELKNTRLNDWFEEQKSLYPVTIDSEAIAAIDE
ncbi:MAG: peptidylprolyl isomerase [Oscillospiraceae bacterium]|nr:peptidylprolyl isomerase [Oscillospiraceae bacterium]